MKPRTLEGPHQLQKTKSNLQQNVSAKTCQMPMALEISPRLTCQLMMPTTPPVRAHSFRGLRLILMHMQRTAHPTDRLP